MAFERTVACIDQLNEWGYEISIGKTVGNQHGYFSATDDERLADLQSMIDDPDIKAILAARGGYGSSRIIDKINWAPMLGQPKWLVGFSDITVFSSFLFQKLQMASIHGPMAGAFNDAAENQDWQYVQSLQTAWSGGMCRYKTEAHPANIPGKTAGPLVGGNLSLLAHQIGTNGDIDTTNCILFLEDVGEYLYSIDRMLVQLDRAGKLSKLAGLIIGGFTQLKDTTIPLGKTIEEMVLEKVSAYGYPVCFGFPVSHEKENFALKVGIPHQFVVKADSVLLEEIVM